MDIEEALYALPNKVVDEVNVNVTLGYEYTRLGDSEVAFLNLQVSTTQWFTLKSSCSAASRSLVTYPG